MALTSHVSVLRHYFKLYDLDCAPLNHRKIHLFIKSVSMNAPYSPRVKANFTIPLLFQLVKACDQIRFGILYKSIFLLAYFGFLRFSNLAPSSSKLFDPTRHFLRSDVILGAPGAHIIVKWAKAMQGFTKYQVIQIPSLTSSSICPVATLKALLSSVRAPPSSPLFFVPPPPLASSLYLLPWSVPPSPLNSTQPFMASMPSEGPASPGL